MARSGVEPGHGHSRPVVVRRSGPVVALTIAGSDSAAGAGLQADLKTFSAHGVYGTTVVTAVTAQSTTQVSGVHPLDADFVELQLEAVTADLTVAAVKTGMLGTTAVVELVGRWAAAGRLPNLVVDPVLASSTGAPLLDEGALAAYRELLLPFAQVATPNLREAALLTGTDPRAMTTIDAMSDAALALGELGTEVVLVKGGHLASAISPDVVFCRGEVTLLAAERVTTENDHGTGCTLSASIAALLARGMEVIAAIEEAKRFVTNALQGAASWRLGAGHGPLDHFGWGGTHSGP